MKERLSLIKSAMVLGSAEAQYCIPRRTRLLINLAAVLWATAYSATYTYAATTGTGCDNAGSSNIQTLLERAAQFLIAIGGALALVMFVVGALFIMSGHKVEKGYKFIKNTVIGLFLLAGGVFIKVVVANLVIGATQATNTTDAAAQQCAGFSGPGS